MAHENYSIERDFFLARMKDELEAGQRFCFILGSGASKSSGIPTGTDLIEKWHKELERKGKKYIDEAMRQVGISEEEYDKYFPSGEFKAQSELYFDYFDMMYPNMPTVAYKALQKEMEAATPSFGYYALAMILTQGLNISNKGERTNHLVITTNFDSLVEDTCFYITGKHPLVVGHESLASFIVGAEIADHPIVAKVHRDLLFHPMNRANEMEKIAEQWQEPICDALKSYVPIVIGYAGGDQTLMQLLLKNDSISEIYWCDIRPLDSTLNSELTEYLKNKSQRFFVKIENFDSIMYDIARVILSENTFNESKDNLPNEIQARYEELVKKYQNTLLEPDMGTEPSDFSDHSGSSVHSDFSSHSELSKTYAKEYQEITEDFVNMSDEELEEKSVFAWRNQEYGISQQYFLELIRRYPDNASYYNSRGVTLHEMKRYEEALKDKSKAIELDGNDAGYYNSRGVTLHEMKRYEEALKDYSKAIELDGNNARYYNSRGVTLHEMKRYGEALKDYSKAIELDGNNERYYSNRRVTLHAMERYEEALADDNRAIELDGDNALYYESRAATFHALGRYEEEQADLKKAEELSHKP